MALRAPAWRASIRRDLIIVLVGCSLPLATGDAARPAHAAAQLSSPAPHGVLAAGVPLPSPQVIARAAASSPAPQNAAQAERIFRHSDWGNAIQRELLRVLAAELKDPQGQFSGFLPKSGLVVVVERGAIRAQLVESPVLPLLRSLEAMHGAAGADRLLLSACRHRFAEQCELLLSYTSRRALEIVEQRTPGDVPQDTDMADGGRIAIAHAVIEELIARGAIDPANNIFQALPGAWQAVPGARSASTQDPRAIQSPPPDPEAARRVIGFTLVENATPRPSEWSAMEADPRLFSVRLAASGITVFRASGGQRRIQRHTSRIWRRAVKRFLAGRGAAVRATTLPVGLFPD
jgi:hypothetical protein